MTDQTKKQVHRRRKLHSHRRKHRVFLLALVLILGSGAFLFYKDKLYAISEILIWLKQNEPAQASASIPAASFRANIYDRNFRSLAATYETYAIYARPLEMENSAASATLLEEILGLKPRQLLASLKSERGFVWIAKDIDQELADTIKERNIKGIYQVVETKRFYPHYDTAAHAVGFVENDQGLDGIEYQYNTLLRGDEISRTELEALHFSDATRFNRTATNLVLNLDLMTQSKIEQFLQRRVKITGAESGGVLIMDADTGAILAMASYPGFNPNRYWEFTSTALNNHLVTEPVYPGELSLLFQQAAAINLRNERRTEAIDNADGEKPILVLEPEILKRKKISSAPRIDYVDPEYLARFSQRLGLELKPLTDIPLKNETPVSSTLALTDPSYHTSALRLLTGFTTLINNGRIVSPHLLYRAYPKENPVPVEPDLSEAAQAVSLHPDTSKDIMDFLAVKWLKMNSREWTAQVPMFIETHRFAQLPENSAPLETGSDTVRYMEQTSRITQSIMLGAIPGKDPKLTMIVLLSYPDDGDSIYPDSLEAFGGKLSVLAPDSDLLQKMIYLADQPPPEPSPDFWSGSGNAVTANRDSHSRGKEEMASTEGNKKNMPDVTGKSLRAGLQVLQHYNMDIKLVGSGRIVSQKPAAGTELKNTTQCILQMQQEI